MVRRYEVRSAIRDYLDPYPSHCPGFFVLEHLVWVIIPLSRSITASFLLWRVCASASSLLVCQPSNRTRHLSLHSVSADNASEGREDLHIRAATRSGHVDPGLTTRRIRTINGAHRVLNDDPQRPQALALQTIYAPVHCWAARHEERSQRRS